MRSPIGRLVLVLVSLVLSACDDPPTRLENGQPAPAFTLPDLDGRPLSFPRDLAGQVVALRFWADWCPFCAPEMREIEPVYQALRAQGLRVLAVNVRQDRETAARFIAGLGVSYQVLLDADGGLARQYGVTGLPTTYFIDREGRLVTRILGETAPGLFERLVRGML
jgi:peroxiredoxin